VSEQTAQGSARAAEERAKKQQREQIRAVVRGDAELRAAIVADLREELREVVREEQTGQFNDMLRRAREQRMAEHAARQAEARRKAPKQVSSSNGHADPFGPGDLEHSPEFMQAIHAGKSYPQAMTLAREAHPETGRPRWQPGTAGNPAARSGSPYAGGSANAFRHETAGPDILWETRNGPLKAGSSAHQAPGSHQPESWPPERREDTAAVLPPGERNSPLNRGI
jgi:hypothetical protein